MPLTLSLSLSLHQRVSLSPSLSLSSSCLLRSPLRFDLRYRILKIVTFLHPLPSPLLDFGEGLISSFFRFFSSNLAGFFVPTLLSTPFGSSATLTLALTCSLLHFPVKQIRETSAKKGDQGRSLSAFSPEMYVQPSSPKLQSCHNL